MSCRQQCNGFARQHRDLLKAGLNVFGVISIRKNSSRNYSVLQTRNQEYLVVSGSGSGLENLSLTWYLFSALLTITWFSY